MLSILDHISVLTRRRCLLLWLYGLKVQFQCSCNRIRERADLLHAEANRTTTPNTTQLIDDLLYAITL
jgi:hypothetical protein